MQMLMWTCGIALFYMLFNCPLFALSVSVCTCLGLHLCITVIYLSISLEVTGSLFLFVLFAFNFSFDSYFLVKPLNFPYLFPISWILLSTLSSISTWRKIHCFISDKQCDHSQLRNLLHFNFLPCKREQESSFLEVLWEGMSGMATAMLMAVIVETSYLSGTLYPSLHYPHDILFGGFESLYSPFYWRGDWDSTWSYGLPNIAENNLYSNLCLCHCICIKFW